MTIMIGNYSFEGSFTDAASLKNQSGVYAVLGRNGQADRWSVLDIGESAKVRDRVENHDRGDSWRRQGFAALAVAGHYCDANSRTRIESELRTQYNPPCGER